MSLTGVFGIFQNEGHTVIETPVLVSLSKTVRNICRSSFFRRCSVLSCGDRRTELATFELFPSGRRSCEPLRSRDGSLRVRRRHVQAAVGGVWIVAGQLGHVGHVLLVVGGRRVDLLVVQRIAEVDVTAVKRHRSLRSPSQAQASLTNSPTRRV